LLSVCCAFNQDDAIGVLRLRTGSFDVVQIKFGAFSAVLPLAHMI
jgi:hypothetical protein